MEYNDPHGKVRIWVQSKPNSVCDHLMGLLDQFKKEQARIHNKLQRLNSPSGSLRVLR